MYPPPPQEWKSWISGQGDILVQADEPPPPNEKVGFQVNVTFWFWQWTSTKIWKKSPKSSKNEMFVFGLCSISDDWSSDPSDECRPNCEKRPPKSSKMKFLFLDYVQFVMINWVIRVMNVDQNVKKSPQVIEKWNVCFWITFNFWWLAEWSKQRTLTEMWKKSPYVIKKWNVHF